MRRRPSRISAMIPLLAAGVAAGLAGPAAAQIQTQGGAQARQRVALELVLAVDVSPTMTNEEFYLQRMGYVEAFRHQDVIDSIVYGAADGVAVTYVEWGASYAQDVIAPWTLIRSREDALRFADVLASTNIYPGQLTSISGALLTSAEMIESNAYEGDRKVIDLSGDGPNNDGPVVTAARDAMAELGIIVNGLPLMLNQPGETFYIPNLEQYYEDCVITGSGAFIAPVRNVEEMAGTIRGKLALEIAGLRVRDDAGAIVPVQFFMEGQEDEGGANCLIGEQMRGSGFR